MPFKKTELKIFKRNPKASFHSVSVEPISWQSQEPVFTTLSVGEKLSRTFRVDTVLEKRGESELRMVPVPQPGLKREGIIQAERAVFLSHSVGLGAQAGTLLGWLTDFNTTV